MMNRRIKLKKKRENPSKPTTVVCCVLVFLGFLAVFASQWCNDQFGENIGIDAILFTLAAGLDGTDSSMVWNFVTHALVWAIVFSAMALFVILFRSSKTVYINFFNRLKLRVFPFHRVFKTVLSVVVCLVLCCAAAFNIGLIDYIRHSLKYTTFYEDNYIDPYSVNITFPEQKRNLIWILSESMETSFMSKEDGGALDHNAIPNLTALAKDNINFSQTEGVGGGSQVTGTEWTIASIVAQTSGIQLKFGRNTYGKSSFLAGVNTLPQLLKDNGYYQAIIMGSNANFANTRTYLTQHGVDDVYDYHSAQDEGLVPSDYHVAWGMEDKYVFQSAKEKITEASQNDQPFSFIVQTIDTHSVGGYVCDLCQNQFSQQYENVYACSDRQIASFVDWIKEQPFYENTTVIIVGDHLSMDGQYVPDNIPETYARRNYNCFINSAVTPSQEKLREFSTLDMFPTILASMGCTIEGDRLGLGTNLFSDKPTLVEQMGIVKLNDELSYNSKYYNREFIMDK